MSHVTFCQQALSVDTYGYADVTVNAHDGVEILAHGTQDHFAELAWVLLACLGSSIHQRDVPVLTAALALVERTHKAGRVCDDACPLFSKRHPVLVL